MWIRRLLFFQVFSMLNDHLLKKRYQKIVIVSIGIQEKIHLLEYFPLNKGNYGEVTDIIQ